MYGIQIGVEIFILGISLALLQSFLRKFELSRSTTSLIIFPLIVFVFGFSLRLTQDKELIDTGFFFTEFSYLFTYLIFATSFVLGQLKYWKRK